MPKIRLGCQTITWKDERAEKCDYIVEQVAQAGYEGIEIGARFLDLDKAADFKAPPGALNALLRRSPPLPILLSSSNTQL